MTKILVVSVFACVPGVAFPQNPQEIRQLFEAGQYQQVVETTPPDAPPHMLYTVAQSHHKLGATEQALEIYRRLADSPERDPWRFIGQSGQQLLAGQIDEALESARQAVTANGGLPEAHFQLGLVLARRQAWAEAAAAFDRVTQLDPSFAYAYYCAGLMHERAKQTDRMTISFERFLKLAPKAPERPEVLQIMRRQGAGGRG
jgi:tetratricopeptide (TPR) repeat protein